MKLQVKFDFIQNLEKQMEEGTEEELRIYQENTEEFFKRGVENLKEVLKHELNGGDYYWIENLGVKVVEK